MTRIIVSQPWMERIVTTAAKETEIGAAVYLQRDGMSDRYLVRSLEFAEGDDCASASAIEFTFAPQFLTRVTRKAKTAGLDFALLHSHPKGCHGFSETDNATEEGLRAFLQHRLPGRRVFSILFCDGTLRARELASHGDLSVSVVGQRIEMFGVTEDGIDVHSKERFDRQVRAFGEGGQGVLSKLTVGIVGLGGTGSVVAQQLAYLGVGAIVLVDPDKVETSNLNRIVGAKLSDVGRNKVDVSRDLISQVGPGTLITSSIESAVSHPGVELLREMDCFFICTDSHVSRAFLSEFAYQYLIPAFDMGVSISARNGKVEAITGRTQMIGPGLACLVCANVIDARAVREELMTPEQRASDPYFNAEGVKQPAVISINSTVASLAVTMFLSAFLGIPGRARWEVYDGVLGTVRSIASRCDASCPICGVSGIEGQADTRDLPFIGTVAV